MLATCKSRTIGDNVPQHASADRRAGDRHHHGFGTLRRIGAGLPQRPVRQQRSPPVAAGAERQPPAQERQQPAQWQQQRRPARHRRRRATATRSRSGSFASKRRSASSPARSSNCSIATSSSKRSCSACRAAPPRPRRGARVRLSIADAATADAADAAAAGAASGTARRACSTRRRIRMRPVRRACSAPFLVAGRRSGADARQRRARQSELRRRGRSARPADAAPVRRSICRPWPARPRRIAPCRRAQPTSRRQAPAQRGPEAAARRSRRLPPSDSPRDNYDMAYGYIMRKDYALAEDGFRNFLRRFPSDRLVPEAQYWLGESMFQRQRYRDAAEAVPRRLDQVRDQRPRARCAAAARSVARGDGRARSGLRVAGGSAAQISARVGRGQAGRRA